MKETIAMYAVMLLCGLMFVAVLLMLIFVIWCGIGLLGDMAGWWDGWVSDH